ncbi:hypothetical protein [Nostoc sp. ChiQUE01b]|uniref:hypothetical protein n=1 Tax=Nostoc sp. ChiQUE01b TaxID=3075376 RepID=UPI002AD23CF8|nr:hypothetical protein [Nostoc sp. ChiQUE01b]MDZ8264552.1 hypothetical protein [Nostoc sp. ChiQUE01b]
MTSQTAFAKIDLLQPAPTQPLGYYDYFGKLLSPQEASQLVVNKREFDGAKTGQEVVQASL